MKRVYRQPDWPESWNSVYTHDLVEIYGEEPPERVGHLYAYAVRKAVTLDLVRKAAPPPARVLDLGAAQGNFTLMLAELGYEVTWNDLRAELAGYVELKRESGRVHYIPGEISGLSRSELYDVVLAGEVIEHVAHPDQFLVDIAEFTRPGGYVVLSTPNGAFFRNRLPGFTTFADPSIFEADQYKPDADGHIFLLHPDEIAILGTRAGLELLELRLFTNFLTQGWAGTGHLLPSLPKRLVDRLERWGQRLPRSLRERTQTAMACLLRRGANARAK